MAAERPIRLGIVGVRRGSNYAQLGPKVGMELVALCDTWEERLRQVGDELGVATYTRFEDMLEHDLDAVMLANYFHQHAPLAIQALQAGKHVLSECAAAKTLGEAVALARAWEQSGCVYMFAENYPFSAYNQEMRRLYQGGEIGEVRFCEGEYIHPGPSDWSNSLSPGMNHWRNWLPSTYYCTHGLGPLMYVTDTMPVSVSAQSIPYPKDFRRQRMTTRRQDMAAVIVCRMDNGALATVNGIGLQGEGNWYRFHGTHGLMENCREYGRHGCVRVVHERWDMEEGQVHEKIYEPEFPLARELAAQAGHGGGDFFIAHFFAEAIRTRQQPWMNVYRGLAMSMVGPQAWRSALDNGASYPIPDFSNETARAAYENDQWSPYPEDAGPGQPPPSIEGLYEPTPEQIAAARKVWREMGYEGE